MNVEEVYKNEQELENILRLEEVLLDIDVKFKKILAHRNKLSWLEYCINLEIDNAIRQGQLETYTQNFMCNANLIEQVTKLFRQKGFEFETIPLDDDYDMFDDEKKDDGKLYKVSFYIRWEKGE